MLKCQEINYLKAEKDKENIYDFNKEKIKARLEAARLLEIDKAKPFYMVRKLTSLIGFILFMGCIKVAVMRFFK